MGGNVMLWLGVALIAVIASGFYIQTREQDSLHALHITSLSQVRNLSATQCWYSSGDYGVGSGGNMYIYGNKIRVSILNLSVSSFSGTMQAVIGLDGTQIMAPATIQAWSSAKNAATALNAVITQAPWKCEPWWFPSSSVMQIPGGVSF